MNRFETRIQIAAFWFAVLGGIGVACLYLVTIASAVYGHAPEAEILKDHFPGMVGLPAAATVSFILVVLLRQTEGPVEFEGLGFKFQGAAGQVAMWMVCFLAFASAIKLVW